MGTVVTLCTYSQNGRFVPSYLYLTNTLTHLPAHGSSRPKAGDDDDDDDETPELNTYWVHAVDLSETIAARDIKAALIQRFERVIGDV